MRARHSRVEAEPREAQDERPEHRNVLVCLLKHKMPGPAKETAADERGQASKYVHRYTSCHVDEPEVPGAVNVFGDAVVGACTARPESQSYKRAGDICENSGSQ